MEENKDQKELETQYVTCSIQEGVFFLGVPEHFEQIDQEHFEALQNLLNENFGAIAKILGDFENLRKDANFYIVLMIDSETEEGKEHVDDFIKNPKRRLPHHTLGFGLRSDIQTHLIDVDPDNAEILELCSYEIILVVYHQESFDCLVWKGKP